MSARSGWLWDGMSIYKDLQHSWAQGNLCNDVSSSDLQIGFNWPDHYQNELPSGESWDFAVQIFEGIRADGTKVCVDALQRIRETVKKTGRLPSDVRPQAIPHLTCAYLLMFITAVDASKKERSDGNWKWDGTRKELLLQVLLLGKLIDVLVGLLPVEHLSSIERYRALERLIRSALTDSLFRSQVLGFYDATPWSGISDDLALQFLMENADDTEKITLFAHTLAQIDGLFLGDFGEVHNVLMGIALPNYHGHTSSEGVGLRHVANWLATGRHVVEVSQQALDTLMKLGEERALEGEQPVNLHDLPLPGDKHYKRTLVFVMKQPGSSRKNYIFARSEGIIMDENAVLFVFGRINATLTEGCYFKHSYVPRVGRDKDMRTLRMHAPYGVFLVAALNALCAMNRSYEVVERRKSRKGKKRTGQSTPLRSVKTLRLDEKGLHVWSRKVIVEERERRTMNPRKQGKHPVKEHTKRMWVLSPRQDEVILDTRERKGKAQGRLYCVERRVTKHTKGQGLTLKHARMKQGLDDLHLPEIAA